MAAAVTKFLFLGMLLALLPQEGYSQPAPLRGTFWVRSDLENLWDGEGALLDQEGFTPAGRRALESLLEEVRWVFSGMIYGLSFSWTPSDAARQVEERFELKPLASLPRGDPRLKILSTASENDFLYVTLAYELDASQAARLEGWKGNRYPSAGGIGRVPLGEDCRRLALEAAIKEGLKAWLQAKVYNKPSRVSGQLALQDIPVTGLAGPFCQARVFLRLNLDEIRNYRVD